MSLRTDLVAAIRGSQSLPKGWDVFGHGHTPGDRTKPIICVRQTNIEKTPGAPRLYRDTDFDVLLVEPAIDPAKVEQALEQDIEKLLDLLDEVTFPGLVWKKAERVVFDAQYHGYTVTVTITNTKE